VPDSERAFCFWRVRSGHLEGISAAAHLHQRWTPGLTTATTRCSVDPSLCSRFEAQYGVPVIAAPEMASFRDWTDQIAADG
jgi:hypothetical protein